ncbi:ComEA family DNA-binding protein [Actinobacillus delphinicola]|uniref:ComEA family DNA-binding protein n=1 Tax=Actinobacillus delphinicola TaxID=51161 RepID=UPI000F84DB7D|nr:helix-hairpin-helix domain-containing protein [Actinobacillus delphinicola]
MNTASAAELQAALVGIGEKKAQAIVEYRKEHGKFTKAEQLMDVKGIGESIFAKNKSHIDL